MRCTCSFGGIMYDKPLNPSEHAFLKILAELEEAHGSVTREILSVATRGRGVEFGRSLARVKSLGLIEETERPAFFLLRLFGAQDRSLVYLTPAGRRALSDLAAPLHGRAPQEDAEDQLAQLTPTDHIAVPRAGVDQDPLAEPVVVSPDRPQPVARTPVVRRRVPLGYTEDLGGVPVPSAPVKLAPGIDPQAMDALREVLSGLGIDLTSAGEMLASHRMAQGNTGAEALMQIVVYTFAHAVHHDLSNGRQIAALGLGDYAQEVRRELQKLRDAGAISAARFDADTAQIEGLMQGTQTSADLATTLLQDPIGGAAPPALLPEELRMVTSDDDSKDDEF